MRLKSLKLAGFKSFANPTTFTFRHGITAIVGPNGCGKSNVIDAIRWVLGETSAKQLRGGAMSDVIFAGTQDKAAKSVASVELTFEHTQDEQTGIRHEFNLYHELSVRRQVNKEGRSDYFINGTRCRRRDVVDVFLGTGLGSRSYAVIEQGMIGRIVDSSPLQLREFVEEAAGVSRYQARRLETQKKLEATEDNLARLQDMQSELARQHKTLSKQAESAERYYTLSESLADIKQQLAIQQLYQAKHQQKQHKNAHVDSSKQLASAQANYDALKISQDKLSAQINQQQWLKDDAQNASHQQQLTYQQAEHQLKDAQAKLSQIQQQIADSESQTQQDTEESNTLIAEQDELQRQLNELRPQLSALTAKRDANKRNEEPLQRAWHAAQNELTLLQEEVRKLEQQQALTIQSQQRMQKSQNKWTRQHNDWQQAWSQLQVSNSAEWTNLSELNLSKSGQSQSGQSQSSPAEPQAIQRKMLTEIDETREQLAQLARQQDNIDERLSEVQPQARQLQQSISTQQAQVSASEKRHAQLAGEYDTLYQILHPKPNKAFADGKINADSHSETTKGITTGQQIAEPLPISTLRDTIELTTKGQEHAALLDSLLALWLDSHVWQRIETNKASTDNSAHNNSASSHFLDQTNLADMIGQHSDGLLAYLSADEGHSLGLPAKPELKRTPHKNYDDRILCLSELIAQPSLALWQQCYVFIDSTTIDNPSKPETLIETLKQLPESALLLTADGWCLSRYGTINLPKLINAHSDGDKTNHASPFLSQRLQQRERLQALETLLEELETQIETRQQMLKKSQREYENLAIDIEETRAQAEQLSRDQHQYQQQMASQQAAYERWQTDMTRLNAQKETLEQEQAELAKETAELNGVQQHIERSLEELQPKVEVAKAQRQHLQEERSAQNRNRQTDDEAYQALKMRIQQGEMRLEHNLSSLTRITERQQQLNQNTQALTTRLQRFEQQLPALQAALDEAKKTRDAQQVLLTERETELDELKQNYTQQQALLESSQETLQTQQIALASLVTELALSEARLKEASSHAQDALAHYQQLTHDSHSPNAPQSISVSSLLTDFITHERRVRPEKIAELQSQQARLERQLSQIGPINLAAVKELAEIDERLQPLTQQIDDIATSMQTLHKAIADIDEATKTLFMQTLDAVNRELANLFAKVFGGGKASLTLNTEDIADDTTKGGQKSEQWRAGLTLMAQPKGKRNSRLAVLSGGEKTLTALSLIFAIFKQHPAPFCVLDEVDAPLDDANVARFTSLIQELADDLQFIFISHNKLSMQIADELQGITMPNAGVSTLVSVSLEDAARYIDS